MADINVEFKDESACCVVMASEGYPKKYATGFEITYDMDLEAEIYVAGAKQEDGKLLTAGGRVLGVVSTADTLAEAVKKSYREVEKVHFENAYYRTDIGAKALKVLEEN